MPPPSNIGISGFSTAEKLISLNPKQHMLMDELTAIINLELSQKTPMIYTNFSFRQDAMKAYFLNVIQNRTHYIDFRHIHLVPMDANNLDQIDNFLDAFEFAGFGYNTWQYTMNSNLPMALLSPLPYFVLTSRVVLFFSDDMNFYISNMNPDTVSSMHNYFNDVYNVCSSFVRYVSAPADFMKFEEMIVSKSDIPDWKEKYIFDASNNLCASSFLTNEMFDEILPEDFPYKSFFTNSLCRFYETMLKKHLMFIFDHTSLLDFINNDPEISDYHQITFEGFSLKPKHKISILKAYCDYVASGHGEVHLLVPSKIQLPKYFHINTFPNGLMLGFNFKTYHPDTQELSISVAATMNPLLHKHFSNFSSFLAHSPYTYSSSHSEVVLKSALEYYASVHPELSSV